MLDGEILSGYIIADVSLTFFVGFNPLKILEILNSVGTYHNLEVNLHMVSGYWSDTFSRDFALCNKSADAIDERAGIAPNWIATKIEVVGPSKKDPPALIEPYSPGLQSENETADEQREVGQGPVASREGASGECKPLRRDYFKSYLKDYEPEKNLFEKVRDWIAGGVAAKSPEQPK